MSGERQSPSRLGFGCASLGSRVGAAAGLRALHQAYDAGVNWFDLAPSYGDGEAETIFAKFASGRREGLYICTKVGRTAPGASPGARLLRPLARRLVAAAPSLRALAARARPPAELHRLNGAFVKTSLDASLQRLGVDYVDVLALHDPPMKDILRDDVQRALDDIRAAGKARGIGIAGASATAVECARLGLGVDVLQFPFEIGGDEAARMAPHPAGRAAPYRLVSYSLRAAAEALKGQGRATGEAQILAALRELGYDMPPAEAIYAAVLDLALQGSSDVILTSMFRPDHLRNNLERLRRTPSAPAAAIRLALGAGPEAGEAR